MNQQLSEETTSPATESPAGDYFSGIGTVVSMELRQRVRARGWYIMLGVWFLVIGIVSVLAWMVTSATGTTGPILFDLVVGFVLFFGLLVAPALSANAVNGDRSAGTLAILQVTLLKPGQILLGKFIASWVASLAFLVVSTPFILAALGFGGVGLDVAAVSLLMLAVELGVVCAIGVGISALANRPLFSIVTSYMVVAGLSIGTLIGFGLSMPMVDETAEVQQVRYGFNDAQGTMERPTCTTGTFEQTIPRTDRVAWILAANPFVVVADAVPYPSPEPGAGPFAQQGVMAGISQAVRYAQAGPEHTVPCYNGDPVPSPPEDLAPQWPLGLAFQLLLAGGLIGLGRRRLVTPAKRLSRGTRIA